MRVHVRSCKTRCNWQTVCDDFLAGERGFFRVDRGGTDQVGSRWKASDLQIYLGLDSLLFVILSN